MASRNQRRRTHRRRKHHTEAGYRRPGGHQQYVPEEDVEGPPELEVPLKEAVEFAKADAADSRRTRMFHRLENAALALEAGGVGVWVVASALFNRGHAGALIGAAVCVVGLILFWTTILTGHWQRVILRHDPWLTVGVACISISPTVGLLVGAWTAWWVGLITGICLVFTGATHVIFLAKEQ